MAKTKNTVIAPLVVVKDEGGSDHYFYQGAVLPSFVADDQLKGLVDSGMVGSEADLAEAQAAEPGAPDGTPAAAPAPKK